jgi:hypothetical protein
MGLASSELLLYLLAVFDIEVDTDPAYKGSISGSQRLSKAEEPPILTLGIANPERHLAWALGAKAVRPDPACFLMVFWMQQRNMRIPWPAGVDS